MKTLFLAFVVTAGLVAITGCSEFAGNPNTTTTSSATISTGSDSKGMVNTTMTDTGIAPEANPANANADVNATAIPYPAIHSNGQHAGTNNAY